MTFARGRFCPAEPAATFFHDVPSGKRGIGNRSVFSLYTKRNMTKKPENFPAFSENALLCNRDAFVFRLFRLRGFRESDLQNTVFKFCDDVFRFDVFTDIETPAAFP